MLNVANVAGVQVTNVGSPDITSDILLRLSKQINEVVCNDPTMAGAVVTHGTDTLEESAFFLDATVNCRKPVVIVGAMRPSTAISADGPLNLLQSVTVATSPKAQDRGALIVMNDRIVSAFYASKTNANTVDTFKAIEMGNLGEVVSNKPYFFYPPVQPTGKTEVDIQNITSIPRVDILYSYEDMHNDTLYSAIQNGAKGIVVSLLPTSTLNINPILQTQPQHQSTTNTKILIQQTRSPALAPVPSPPPSALLSKTSQPNTASPSWPARAPETGRCRPLTNRTRSQAGI